MSSSNPPSGFHKPMLLCFFAIASLFHSLSLYATDPPVGPGLISTLKDVQKAYYVLHRIDDQEEQLHLYFSNDDQAQIHSFLAVCIRMGESLKTQSYSSTTLQTHMQSYVDLTVKNYQALNKQGLRQNEYKKELDTHNMQRRDLSDFLVKTYALNHFVHLTEDAYWKTINKKNYILSPRYSVYLKRKNQKISQALSLLDSIYQACTDFQEKAIYQLEAGDQYEQNSNTLRNGGDVAVQKYLWIIDQKQYCLYLYEAWLKWRVVSQQHGGLSKSSEIPNDQYDEVRNRVADVILAHIQQNEKDEMAINQFFVIVTHDIIFRFGEYPYGNQNTVEYHQLFDE